MNVKQAVAEKEQTGSANLLWVSEPNVSICGLTMNQIYNNSSIFIADRDLDLAPGMNAFSAFA